jgi:thiol-disulfide isomerase/thioredoxin
VVLIAVGLLVASGYATLLASSQLAAILPNAERLITVNTSPPPPPASTNTNFEPMPSVQFQKLDGQNFSVEGLRGNVVLLNFWATWCIPCREEIPILNAMQKDLGGRGLRIVGASLEDTAAGIEEYQNDVARFEYDVVVGGSDAQAKFGGTPLPTTYLIDRSGRIRQKIVGARDRAGWEAAVKPLLEEAQTAAINK